MFPAGRFPGGSRATIGCGASPCCRNPSEADRSGPGGPGGAGRGGLPCGGGCQRFAPAPPNWRRAPAPDPPNRSVPKKNSRFIPRFDAFITLWVEVGCRADWSRARSLWSGQLSLWQEMQTAEFLRRNALRLGRRGTFTATLPPADLHQCLDHVLRRCRWRLRRLNRRPLPSLRASSCKTGDLRHATDKRVESGEAEQGAGGGRSSTPSGRAKPELWSSGQCR